MDYTALQRNRFLVRRGSGDDWMVYDRELKGPAQTKKGGPFAEKLTKKQAEELKQILMDGLAGNIKNWTEPRTGDDFVTTKDDEQSWA